jgi:hypothetical protein
MRAVPSKLTNQSLATRSGFWSIFKIDYWTDRHKSTDRYHRPIDSPLRFWPNKQEVSDLSLPGPSAAQLGYVGHDLRKALGRTSLRRIREVMGE